MFFRRMKTRVTKSGYKILQILSGRSNVFLLTNGVQNMLVDTGSKNNRNKLDKRLIDFNISHIDYLILTHTHFDHAGNAHWINEKYRTQVIVHKSEASYLTAGDNIFPKGTNIVTRLIVNLFAERIFTHLRYEPCRYDVLVDSKLDLKDFGFNAHLLHTPGHTVGSVSVVIDNEIAIVGDTMFGVFKWSVFPPFANDVNQLVNSWGILLKTGCSVFIPSHGTANSRSQVQKNFNKRLS